MKKMFVVLFSIFFILQFSVAISEDNPLKLSEPKNYISYEKMTVIPILSSKDFNKSSNDFNNIINLKNALENDFIIISERNVNKQERGLLNYEGLEQPNPSREQESVRDTNPNVLTQAEIDALMVQTQSGRSDVNNLSVSNKSDKYIYLMAGDIVKGGKQDRVIAKDVIIPPKTEAMNLPVFCVEQHRWSFQGDSINFGKYSNVVSNAVRSAVQVEQEQSAVWSKVSTMQNAYGVTSETGAYTDVEKSDEFKSKSDDYLNFFSEKIDNVSDIVGMIVVTGDSIMGCDIFGHKFIFGIQYRALLNSYITDALTISAKSEIDNIKIEKFFKDAKVEYFSAPKKDPKHEKRFFHDGIVVHYTKFK